MVAAIRAEAQGTARSLDIDASIRSAGMGGACNAVFWGADPNDWANPALLGYHSGLRYSWGKTRLVPGLAPDVFFKTQRITVGSSGVGIGVPGNLNGYGSTLLDYGLLQGLDPQGNPAVGPRAFERIRSWGIGVSLARLAGAAFERAGRSPPRFLRYADFAAGYNDKHVVVDLGGPSGETDARDFGFLVSATPLDYRNGRQGRDAGLPLRIDLAYGKSILNYNDASIIYLFEPSPTSRIFRDGLAAHTALGVVESVRKALGEREWLIRSLDPLFSLGLSSDWEHVQAGDDKRGYDVERQGVEFSVMNVLTVRGGHVRDRLGDIDGGTFGLGAGFCVGDVAGFRYDWATIPQASGLERVKRRGFTVFVDPFRLGQMRRGRGPSSL